MCADNILGNDILSVLGVTSCYGQLVTIGGEVLDPDSVVDPPTIGTGKAVQTVFTTYWFALFSLPLLLIYY